jgi:hypothetical protein
MIVSLGTALTLTACGNTTQPQSASPTDSASASASVTGAPSPTSTAVYKPADAKGKAENVPVPVLPEAAKANTKEGVEAFARYWFQALSYAYETGDTEHWSPKTASQCVFCASLKKGLDSGYSKGRWLVGGKMTTPSIRALYKPDAPSQQVEIQTIQDQIDYFEADGSISQPPTPPSNSATVMIAVFESDAWKVSDLGLIQ